MLDKLAATDPAAMASRRDLRRMNALFGGETWLLKRLAGTVGRGECAVEFGAGEGRLLGRLAARRPDVQWQGWDLQERPQGLRKEVGWQCGDILTGPGKTEVNWLFGNLILHHFSDADLLALGQGWLTESVRGLLFVEPRRSWLSLVLLKIVWPLLHPVTRHDAAVSVRAGFCRDELALLLGLDAGQWRMRYGRLHFGVNYFEAVR